MSSLAEEKAHNKGGANFGFTVTGDFNPTQILTLPWKQIFSINFVGIIIFVKHVKPSH
jgi:hypothetical protein